MHIPHQKFTCAALAIAVTLSSTIEHPTQASISKCAHDGDDVKVVLKPGEKRKFQAPAVNETEIRAGCEEPVKYMNIEEVRTYRDAKDAARTTLVIVGIAVGVAAIVGLILVARRHHINFNFAAPGEPLGSVQ